MKTKLLMYAATAGLLLMQSCSKNESSKSANPAPNVSSKLKANVVSGSYGSYEVYCVSSSLALEIGSTSEVNGGTADQYTYYAGGTGGSNINIGFNNQVWNLTLASNGYYTFMNEGSGKMLDDPGSSKTSGVQLDQYTANGTNAQYWKLISIGYGAYEVVNIASGLALTNHGASNTSGTAITQETYANNSSQWWVFTPVTPGAYRDDVVTGFFQRTSGSDAFDGASSVPLTYGGDNGKVFWQTNDCFYNNLNGSGEFPCGTTISYRNSGLMQPSLTNFSQSATSNVTSPAGVQIFQDSNSGDLLWPGGMVEINNHIYVSCIEVPSGSLGADNQFLCDITESGSNSVGTVNQLTVPNMSGQTAITYTIGMVKPGDGYVYAYGAGGYLGADVFVARFAATNAGATAWTFWNGTTWASTPSTASAAVIASGPINNNTVGYANGKYVLVEMDYGFSCDASPRDVFTLTSTSPTGPFSNQQTVYALPDKKQGHEPVFYNPTIHSEFINGHNELLVDYCVNFYGNKSGGGVCLTNCSNPDGTQDPNDYRPKAIRIPYSLIGL